MKYEPSKQTIPPDKRRELNEKILYLIDNNLTDEYEISGADIYNLYTGDGGLHGLKRSDYANDTAYSKAKKEIENGQFFTPSELCKTVAEMLSPSVSSLTADLTCGMGRFFNFLPTESNLYGCELDAKAYKVAKHLYPSANIEHGDIRTYKPSVRFDFIVGNPPFNLAWWTEMKASMTSQLYYCVKAEELLKPLGIMAIIVPCSFMADDFGDKSEIRTLQSRFRFLGQAKLPENAFRGVGVERFATKLQFWQKRCSGESTDIHPYRVTYDTLEWIRDNSLREAKSAMSDGKLAIQKELAQSKDDDGFAYMVNRMLYQISCHPKLVEHYVTCEEYVHRYLTEKQPEGMPYEEWERKRLTKAKVLGPTSKK